MKKRIAAILFALCLVFALAPGTALAADETLSGECGPGVSWNFDPVRDQWNYITGGTLTISGNGAIKDYSNSGEDYVPWSTYRSYIDNLIIEEGVTSIGNNAFRGYFRLTSVDIPNGVTSIGESAFSGCSKLTSVDIPEGVTSIGEYAFSDCSSLTSVDIPDSVTSIGNGAFYECSSLTSVNIPNGVTSIGEYAFYYCSSLTSIAIPEGITSIERSTFFNCSGLTNVTIPNGVLTISDYAFSGCSSLTSVSIPASVLRLEDRFNGCTSLTDISVAPTNVEYASEGGVLFNKEKSVLLRCPEGKTSCNIPSGVTSIGGYAFSGCAKLTSVTIPYGVESIGSNAFSACTALANVTIPNSVTSMGYDTFKNCTSLTEITLPSFSNPNSRYYPLYNIFPGCTGLKTVTIPEGFTYLNGTFSGCSNLTTVYIPVSVTEISSNTFANCLKLKNVYYAGNETQWGQIKIASGNAELSLANITFQSATPVEPGPVEPNPIVATVANGGLGRKVTVRADAGHWLTVQVRRGGSIAITSVQAPGGSGKVSMSFSAAVGSVVQIWETAGEMTFENGVPANPILAVTTVTLN